MSRTHEELLARFNELGKRLNSLKPEDDALGGKAQAIIEEMTQLVDENDALKAAKLAKELEEYEAEKLTDEILKHAFIGRGFNIVCKCGYVGKEVSKKDDFERHIAESLVAAGWRNTRYDPYLDTQGQHPGEDWT